MNISVIPPTPDQEHKMSASQLRTDCSMSPVGSLDHSEARSERRSRAQDIRDEKRNIEVSRSRSRSPSVSQERSQPEPAIPTQTSSLEQQIASFVTQFAQMHMNLCTQFHTEHSAISQNLNSLQALPAILANVLEASTHASVSHVTASNSQVASNLREINQSLGNLAGSSGQTVFANHFAVALPTYAGVGPCDSWRPRADAC